MVDWLHLSAECEIRIHSLLCIIPLQNRKFEQVFEVKNDVSKSLKAWNGVHRPFRTAKRSKSDFEIWNVPILKRYVSVHLCRKNSHSSVAILPNRMRVRTLLLIKNSAHFLSDRFLSWLLLLRYEKSVNCLFAVLQWEINQMLERLAPRVFQ